MDKKALVTVSVFLPAIRPNRRHRAPSKKELGKRIRFFLALQRPDHAVSISPSPKQG